MKRIAIFASGKGSNAEKIIKYFKEKKTAEVALIISNKADAGVLKIAGDNKIPSKVIDRESFYKSEKVVRLLKEERIDLVVLAGFLWLIPDSLIKAFPNKIINIHPALLPAYGGKGMYGDNVHRAVLAKKEKETGISIHYVNSNYDEGEIILQVRCPVDEKDTCEALAAKIHRLEHEFYPKAIEQVLLKQ